MYVRIQANLRGSEQENCNNTNNYSSVEKEEDSESEAEAEVEEKLLNRRLGSLSCRLLTFPNSAPHWKKIKCF